MNSFLDIRFPGDLPGESLSKRKANRLCMSELGRHNIVGPTYGGTSTAGPATGRQDISGGSVVSMGQAALFEIASRGILFGACEQTGIALATTISTTAHLSLYNPRGSAKLLVMSKVSMGYISGTLAPGTVFHCANVFTDAAAVTAIAAPTNGTLLNIYNRRIGVQLQNELSDPVAVCRTNSTVTAPVAIRPFFSMHTIAAATAAVCYAMTEDMKGSIVIEPGYCYQIQTVSVGGTSPIMAPAVEWYELPWYI